MKLIKNTLIIGMITSNLLATTITGVGYAVSESEAKKEALSDLSNNISVNVKSDFQTIIKTSNKRNYNKLNKRFINLSSNLPILGASFDKVIEKDMVKAIATIDSKTARKIYLMEIRRIFKNILSSQTKLKSTKDENKRYMILTQMLKNIDSFNKHKIIASLLGAKYMPNLDITRSEISNELQKYISSSSSIEIASDILTKGIDKQNIYISSIKVEGSSEVTQFAKILKNNIANKLNTTKYSSNADYFLNGEYEILKDSIFITIRLSDINNKIIKTNIVTLNKKAYENIKYKPSTLTFDKAMNSGYIKSSKLSVNVGLKGYNRDNGIDLNKGDKVDIVVKANKPICYFLVGHTLKDDKKFSYTIGDIRELSKDEVNKYIEIYKDVPVLAPFGNETLQIFASTLKKDGSCPLVYPKCTDNYDGYCVIDGEPAIVVSKTRALNLSKREYNIEKAENSISFTSFDKIK